MAGIQKKTSVIKILTLTTMAVLLAAVGVVSYLYWQERDKVKDLNDQVASLRDQIPLSPEEEVAKLVEEVGKLYEIPVGETPVVATVEDISKFENQVFFVNAQNGDKLLIFNEAKWALLYRPSSSKIINSGPTAESVTETTEEEPEVEPEAEETE